MKSKYNYDKLKGRIKEMFDTQEKFADAINISVTTLNYKLNNKKPWSQNDIFNSIVALKINKEEIQEYFFCKMSWEKLNIRTEKERSKMDYYDSKDIVKITGLCKSSSYKLIDKLNEKLKKEYPGTITINARIPKWYFEKKVLLKEPERSD